MRVGRAWLWAGLLVLSSGSGSVLAQTPENTEVKLARVLPSDAAERVLQRVAEARALGLPAAALEQRALELSAKGVSPDPLSLLLRRNKASALETRDALNAVTRHSVIRPPAPQRSRRSRRPTQGFQVERPRPRRSLAAPFGECPAAVTTLHSS